MHAELGGHLADRGPPVAREQLEDLRRPVHGLDATTAGLVVLDVQRHHPRAAGRHRPHGCDTRRESPRAASITSPTRSMIQSWNAPMWCSLGTSTPPPA